MPHVAYSEPEPDLQQQVNRSVVEEMSITGAMRVGITVTTRPSPFLRRITSTTQPLWDYVEGRRSTLEAVVTNEKDLKTLRAILRRATITRVQHEAQPMGPI